MNPFSRPIEWIIDQRTTALLRRFLPLVLAFGVTGCQPQRGDPVAVEGDSPAGPSGRSVKRVTDPAPAPLPSDVGSVYELALSPDGRYIAWYELVRSRGAGHRHRTRVWSLRAGRE